MSYLGAVPNGSMTGIIVGVHTGPVGTPAAWAVETTRKNFNNIMHSVMMYLLLSIKLS